MRRQLGAVLMTVGLGLAVAGPATAASAVPPFDGLEYVALGDSYSAGFGLLPVVPGSPDGCYRAEQNYPHRVATQLGLALTDMTCSGAVTANIDLLGQTTMNGVGPLPLQGSALSATTDIVTLTIGGNDLGFATVAETCIRLTASDTHPLLLPSTYPNCKDFYNPLPNVDQLIFKLDNTVGPALERVFGYIATQAPNAKVFVLGYPQIAPDFATAPTGCYSSPIGPTWPNPPFPQNTVPYSTIDVHYLHHIESEMDDAIQTASDAHGFTFIPTWSATEEHTVCSSDPYIFGVGFTNNPADGTPIALGLYTTLGALHPNEEGVPFMASEAVAAMAGHPAFGSALPGSGKPEIAATGYDGTPLALVGVGIALVGFVLVAARRRRVA